MYMHLRETFTSAQIDIFIYQLHCQGIQDDEHIAAVLRCDDDCFQKVPAGVDVDPFLLACAARFQDCIVVRNDLFRGLASPLIYMYIL